MPRREHRRLLLRTSLLVSARDSVPPKRRAPPAAEAEDGHRDGHGTGAPGAGDPPGLSELNAAAYADA